MLSESAEIIRSFVNGFSYIHKQDSRQAYTMLISAFITCFSILSPDDRYKCMYTLVRLVTDIESELFEDGTDFISFLKEKTIEKGIQHD